MGCRPHRGRRLGTGVATWPYSNAALTLDEDASGKKLNGLGVYGGVALRYGPFPRERVEYDPVYGHIADP